MSAQWSACLAKATHLFPLGLDWLARASSSVTLFTNIFTLREEMRIMDTADCEKEIVSFEMMFARENTPSTSKMDSEPESVVMPIRAKTLSTNGSQIVHESAPVKTSSPSAEMMNETGLRTYVSNLANSGQLVHSTLLVAPTSPPEVTSSLPELFWKLVERRIHAAAFTYMVDGKLRQDMVRVTPNGYALTRS